MASYNPQLFPGVAPATQKTGKMRVANSHSAVVTSGFNDRDATFKLVYDYKQQPDVGGALDYAYDTYGLPLQNVAGAFMVARTPYMPLGSMPLTFFAMAVPTGIGTIPGQTISQPLLNPQGPGNGYDIYS